MTLCCCHIKFPILKFPEWSLLRNVRKLPNFLSLALDPSGLHPTFHSQPSSSSPPRPGPQPAWLIHVRSFTCPFSWIFSSNHLLSLPEIPSLPFFLPLPKSNLSKVAQTLPSPKSLPDVHLRALTSAPFFRRAIKCHRIQKVKSIAFCVRVKKYITTTTTKKP